MRTKFIKISNVANLRILFNCHESETMENRISIAFQNERDFV